MSFWKDNRSEAVKLSIKVKQCFKPIAGLVDCEEIAFCLANILYEKGYTVFIQTQWHIVKAGLVDKGHAYVKYYKDGVYGEAYKLDGAGWVDVPGNDKELRFNNALRKLSSLEVADIMKRDTDLRSLRTDLTT